MAMHFADLVVFIFFYFSDKWVMKKKGILLIFDHGSYLFSSQNLY